MKRDYGIDLIRVVSCLVVVMAHVLLVSIHRSSMPVEETFRDVIEQVIVFLRWPPAVFFMITGYCMAMKKNVYVCKVSSFRDGFVSQLNYNRQLLTLHSFFFFHLSKMYCIPTECPFDASMMTWFCQRISAEMLAWVNDEIIGRRTAAEKKEEDYKDDDSGSTGSNGQEESKGGESEEENQGTLILDATCAPQNIRFPTDASRLNEARQKAEEIIDILHENGLTDGKRPKTHRVKVQRKHNSYFKPRKKIMKMIRTELKQQQGFLRRDLGIIDSIEEKYPGCLKEVLPAGKYEMLQVIRTLYSQQKYMYRTKTHKVPDRIVSIFQHWIRPIVRGKETADAEFGAKVEMNVADGFLRIEDLRWDAYNESTTFQESVEYYKRSYGHYPKRVLADKIFRTRENMQYCKQRGIHLNGPKLGKPYADLAIQKQQKQLEWQEFGEWGEIERNFGIGKRRYGLNCIVTKLKETSEAMIHASVMYMNLRKKLRLLLRLFFSWLWNSIQDRLEGVTLAFT